LELRRAWQKSVNGWNDGSAAVERCMVSNFGRRFFFTFRAARACF
jgi:hypothetical protein